MRLCGMAAERVIPNYYFIILSCTLAVIGPLKALGQTWWAAGNGWEYLLGDARSSGRGLKGESDGKCSSSFPLSYT
jgi:hypothetical protein